MADLEPLGIKTFALDVTDKQQIASCVEHIMSVEHRIDVLVNNAGLLAKAPVVEAGMEHFRQVMETNFFGCLELIAAVTPQMIQRQTGTIINIGSIASYTSQPFWAAYSASKAALMSVTDAMRTELKPLGVKVVYCAPGFIATQLDSKSRQSGMNYLDPKGPYGSNQQISDWVHKTDGISNGTPPAAFAKGFVDMALSSSPPPHYVNGKMAWVVWFLGKLMPLSVMDGLYAKASGLQQLAAA
ncbi:hypothetical protein OEZ85_005196 [Tetradesmus obliquus]|uniref:Uncharacterized protein n=1 Tax=Tetradesmus obliquus TaxID=3088 RepID=A0ABY8UH77_TETOB|nr:hypothetical protein OEZ85_005196 [Tetradesmus obliquus]